MLSKLWALALLASLVALAACASPNPRLYTIAPVNGAVHTGGPSVVVMQQIVVARYLERSQFVRSSENYRLDVRLDDWWGEPLASMLGRVLTDELDQRLPRTTVLSENGAVASTPDATIALNISRLDQDAAGTLVLQAQLSVLFKGRPEPLLRSFRFMVTPAGVDMPAAVAAISVAVGRLADGVASVLTNPVAR